ncbi:cytochrome c oxidase subunit II [Sporosarcina pasteurii]|uniref:Cytochrome aa3 subunit 2 n=1 Tax=Sporosarcina pasteurii TaxID=1474 RepID=A0A380C478_SPOPA|nr:cytochrome c oxidase subunit II [Sporosarcina pasteurii]MDS9471600.1 cytochrome c oxidase subunit II [Sporosarcina pasteurii]QBQ04787.1 cytochrome C oxidase subunit II [Sporosarcina pasteurii]SUJ11259.1 Cytochrome c oxidase subunit 2 [Sporosarcina pasteurii]
MKIHRYEKIWLALSFGIILAFMLIIGVQAFAFEHAPPSHKEIIDPQKVDVTAPFDNPGVFQTGDNEYEVVMTLQAFGFTPHEVEVPAGAKVTFTLTSKDVIHGFQIAQTNVNAMVVPGHIQKVTQTFRNPGEYLVLCNEYCGIGHEMMGMTITVK